MFTVPQIVQCKAEEHSVEHQTFFPCLHGLAPDGTVAAPVRTTLPCNTISVRYQQTGLCRSVTRRTRIAVGIPERQKSHFVQNNCCRNAKCFLSITAPAGLACSLVEFILNNGLFALFLPMLQYGTCCVRFSSSLRIKYTSVFFSQHNQNLFFYSHSNQWKLCIEEDSKACLTQILLGKSLFSLLLFNL